MNLLKEILRWHGYLSGWPLYFLYFKRKTYYEDRSVSGRRPKGGALVVSNHFHVYDYIVNAGLFPLRKLYVLLRGDVLENKFIRFGMSIFGGIGVDRESMSMKFVDEGVSHLKKGHLVQIFPEGYINQGDGELMPFKTGYVMIAQRAEAPIIPVITDGNYGLKKRVHVMVGKPIYLCDHCSSAYPNREEIVELNRIVYEKCLELQAELRRRVEAEKR